MNLPVSDRGSATRSTFSTQNAPASIPGDGLAILLRLTEPRSVSSLGSGSPCVRKTERRLSMNQTAVKRLPAVPPDRRRT
jgi:hypothetical protein